MPGALAVTTAALKARVRRGPALLLTLTALTLGGIPALWFATTYTLVAAIKYPLVPLLGVLAIAAMRAANPAPANTRKAQTT